MTYDNFLNKYLVNKDSKTFFNLGSIIIKIFYGRDIIRFITDDNNALKIVVSEDYVNQFIDNLIIEPSSLPMITLPAEWSDKSYGGF